MDDQLCKDFFLEPRSTFHRRYEALRAFFIEGRPPAEVAARFGYKPAALNVLISRFRRDVRSQDIPPFRRGRPRTTTGPGVSVTSRRIWVEGSQPARRMLGEM